MTKHGTAKTYFSIFGWLAFLTLLELIGAAMHMPRAALIIFILSTALGKALLIALYFMHLKFDTKWVWFLPGIPVLLGLIFIFGLFPDMVYHLTSNF